MQRVTIAKTVFRQLLIALITAVLVLIPAEGLAIQGISLQTGVGHIAAYQQNELDDRQPLILVHGIGGADGSRYYKWDEFLAFADDHAAFKKRYKVYLFIYDSSHSVSALSRELHHDLRALIEESGNRKVRVVAYSEGGLLVRNALQDPWLDAHIDKVIAIATPFHGSPLASPAWIKRELEDESVFNPVRMGHRFAYWVTRMKFPFFESDFGWDNFDGALLHDPFAKANSINHNYILAKKDNFITYGSYFGVEGDMADDLPGVLGVEKPLPEEENKLSNIFSKNFLFTLVNKTMAGLTRVVKPGKEKPMDVGSAEAVEDLATAERHVYAAVAVAEENRQAAHTVRNVVTPQMLSMMAYNDGISPISSTLWLGRYTPEFEDLKNPVSKAWEALKSLKGKQVARLFPGLDHRNWMDNETRTATNKVTDLLNPEEPPKTVFEWILHDLMT